MISSVIVTVTICFILFIMFYSIWYKLDEIYNDKNLFGKYPCNDHLNNALRHLLESGSDSKKLAITEILYAIEKGDGYVCEDVLEMMKERSNYYLWLAIHKEKRN